MMTEFKFRITSVDHYGYNGRDHHPSDDMIGEIVTPVGLITQSCDAEGKYLGQLDQVGETPEWRRKIIEQADKDGVLIHLWHCVRPNGEFVDLVDEEVTLVITELPSVSLQLEGTDRPVLMDQAMLRAQQLANETRKTQDVWLRSDNIQSRHALKIVEKNTDMPEHWIRVGIVDPETKLSDIAQNPDPRD